MSKLPIVSGHKVVKVLVNKAGFKVKHQKGDHIFLEKAGDTPVRLPVPLHKVLDRGTLRAIIRESKIDKDKFLELL